MRLLVWLCCMHVYKAQQLNEFHAAVLLGVLLNKFSAVHSLLFATINFHR
jgi:hypothetical protein